jgi:hypothetical protein
VSKRKLAAVLTVFATALTTGVVTAAPADAYLFHRDGYTFADTSYRNNVPGSYFRTVSRYDPRGYVFVGVTGYDQTCDRFAAAIRIRGYDVQTRRWRYEQVLWVSNPCRGDGQGVVAVPVATTGVDAIIVQDGLRDLTFGSNSVRIWYRG